MSALIRVLVLHLFRYSDDHEYNILTILRAIFRYPWQILLKFTVHLDDQLQVLYTHTQGYDLIDTLCLYAKSYDLRSQKLRIHFCSFYFVTLFDELCNSQRENW